MLQLKPLDCFPVKAIETEAPVVGTIQNAPVAEAVAEGSETTRYRAFVGESTQGA